MNIISANSLVDQLEGATIVSAEVREEEGMHIVLEDGRVLVIAGMFALSLMRLDTGRLH